MSPCAPQAATVFCFSPCAPQAPTELFCPHARRRRQRKIIVTLRAAGACRIFLSPWAPQAPTVFFCPLRAAGACGKFFDANGKFLPHYAPQTPTANSCPPARRKRQRKIVVLLRAADANGKFHFVPLLSFFKINCSAFFSKPNLAPPLSVFSKPIFFCKIHFFQNQNFPKSVFFAKSFFFLKINLSNFSLGSARCVFFV